MTPPRSVAARQARGCTRHLSQSSPKRRVCYDRERYKIVILVENALCSFKELCRFDNRYDKPAANFLSGVVLAVYFYYLISSESA